MTAAMVNHRLAFLRKKIARLRGDVEQYKREGRTALARRAVQEHNGYVWQVLGIQREGKR